MTAPVWACLFRHSAKNSARQHVADQRAETLQGNEEGEPHPLVPVTLSGEDPFIGRLIDERYRIVGRLGQGGMGIVYEARHEVLGSRLAFKVLHHAAAGDAEAIERLKREAQTASTVGNEHIVDVRDFGRLDDGSVYVVMELIDGEDLYSIVRRAPLPWQRAREIALQICEALQAAHERAIVHRDLKPENVLLTSRRGKDDFVKVVDFGIAKLLSGGKKLTAAGRVMGTPQYMSPEQCSGKSVDARTDVYALGVMLYEMVTQKLPFWDPDIVKLVKLQMHERPTPPSSVRPEAEIPLAFEAVILRCLAKDPAARFQSMRAVMQALRLADSEVERVEEEPPPPEPASAREIQRPAVVEPTPVSARTTSGRASARPWLWPAVGLSALALCAAIVWAVKGEPREPAEARVEEPSLPRQPQVVEAPPPSAPSVDERSAEVLVVTSPTGAEVFGPDGALLGQTPFAVRRPASGEHLDLELRLNGFEPQTIRIGALSQDELQVALAARRARVRPTSQTPNPSEAAPRSEPPPAQPQAEPHGQFIDPWGAR
jgi:serine/threonine protein kinase